MSWEDDPEMRQWLDRGDADAEYDASASVPEPSEAVTDAEAIPDGERESVAAETFPPAGSLAPPFHPSAAPKPKVGRRWSASDSKSRRAVAIAVGLLLVLCTGGLVVARMMLGHDGDSSAVPQTLLPSTVAADHVAGADCPTRTDGAVSTGRDAGGQDSGPAVIKAFDHAYYVTRSGSAARSVVTPNAKVGAAEQIDAALTHVEDGTLHCLKITDQGAGAFAVELTEIPPRGADPVVVHQLVQTSVADGKTWISSIEKDPKYQ